MDLTIGQLTLPYVAHLELEHCAAEALHLLFDLLDHEAVGVLCERRADSELERLMVLADELAAVLLAP